LPVVPLEVGGERVASELRKLLLGQKHLCSYGWMIFGKCTGVGMAASPGKGIWADTNSIHSMGAVAVLTAMLRAECVLLLQAVPGRGPKGSFQRDYKLDIVMALIKSCQALMPGPHMDI
jgi:hypothetical protein